MDEIAHQLRSEVRSLEEHIRRTEDRFLVAHWASELIGPFEQLESRLDRHELRAAVIALHCARTRFGVNGVLAERIDAILERHPDIAGDLPAEGTAAYEDVVLTADGDPGDPVLLDGAGSLFVEEDEELLDVETEGGGRGFDLSPEDADAAALAAAGAEADADDLFAVAPEVTRTVAPAAFPTGGADDPPGMEGGADALFAAGEAPPGPAAAGGAVEGRLGPRPESPDRTRGGTLQPRDKSEEELFRIFSDTVSLDDLAAALDIAIPGPDRQALDADLRARLSDRVMASLRTSKLAAGQYILLPRLARFATADGEILPCTVKNLAKRYTGLFGNIRDLMRYRNAALMSSEVPEAGWALVTAEAPRESLDKNYMDQNQYLRYLSTTLGIPSHLVRRRTLAEALYDLVVGKLVLGKRLQRATLDWTSSSPAKNDYVCIYYPNEGIRVRDLSRVTHNRSLGVTPNW